MCGAMLSQFSEIGPKKFKIILKSLKKFLKSTPRFYRINKFIKWILIPGLYESD